MKRGKAERGPNERMLNRMATLVIYGLGLAPLCIPIDEIAPGHYRMANEEPTMIHVLRAKNCRIIWPIIKRAIDRPFSRKRYHRILGEYQSCDYE